MVRGLRYSSAKRTPLRMPAYTFYEPPFSLQRLVNIYPDKLEGQDQQPYVFRRMQGFEFWLGFIDGVILAHKIFKNVLYIATANSLFKCQTDKSFVKIGTIGGASDVQILNTASSLVLRIDAAIYTHTTNNVDSLVQVVDADLQPSEHLAVINNYVFSVVQNGDGQFQWSDFNNPSSYDALNFATAEYRADGLNSIVDHRNEILMFGDNTIEFWAVVGGSNVVAPRNYASNIGCRFKNTIKKIKDSLYFMGTDPLNNEISVYRLNGYNPVQVASKYVKKVLSGVNLSDAYAYTHHENGYDFYTLVVPGVGSFSYITVLDTWVERRSWNVDQGVFKKDVDISEAFSFADETLMYNKDVGSLFRLGGNTENGVIMPWEIVTPYKVNKPYNVTLSQIELDIAAGAGIVGMSFSRDEGKTWTGEDWLETPLEGREDTSLVWNRLGSHHRVAFRFRGFGNADITGAYIGT